METCPTCEAELEPLDVACPKCGVERDDQQAVEAVVDAAIRDVVDTDLADELATALAGPAATVASASSDTEPQTANRSADDTPPPPPPKYRIEVVLTVVVGAIGLGNFLIAPIIWLLAEATFLGEEVYVMAIAAMYATACSQFVLLTLWFALAPLTLPNRLLVGTGVGAFWLFAILGGVIMIEPGAIQELSEWLEMRVFVAPLPFFFLTLISPLWCAKKWFGWRVERFDPSGEKSAPRQPMRIIDLMIATGAIAVTLALAKLGNTDDDMTDAMFLGAISLYCLPAAFLSMISLFPCAWAGLRENARPSAVAVAGAVHLGLVMFPMLLFSLATFGQGGMAVVWGYALLFIASYFALVMFPLIGVRRCGFYLRWGQE